MLKKWKDACTPAVRVDLFGHGNIMQQNMDTSKRPIEDWVKALAPLMAPGGLIAFHGCYVATPSPMQMPEELMSAQEKAQKNPAEALQKLANDNNVGIMANNGPTNFPRSKRNGERPNPPFQDTNPNLFTPQKPN